MVEWQAPCDSRVLAADGDGGERKRAGWLVKAVRRFEGSPVKLGGHHLFSCALGYLLFLILPELSTDLFAIYRCDLWEVPSHLIHRKVNTYNNSRGHPL